MGAVRLTPLCGDSVMGWCHAGAMDAPVAGHDYPRTLREFNAWFPDEAACLDYLVRLRWPGGFACPMCGLPHVRREAVLAHEQGPESPLRRLPAGRLDHGGDDPRRHPPAACDLVRGRLVRHGHQARGERALAPAGARAGKLRNGLGAAAQAAPGGRDRLHRSLRRLQRSRRGWLHPLSDGDLEQRRPRARGHAARAPDRLAAQAGCSAPTKAPSAPSTSRTTCRSSPSASTAAARPIEACSSTACSSRPFSSSTCPSARSRAGANSAMPYEGA